MKLKERNYLGFNHQAVKDKFDSRPEFVCEMPIPMKSGGGYIPVPCAVYKNLEPKLEKGHKPYLLLFSHGDSYYFSGRTEEEMEKLWNCNAIYCRSCHEVLISIDRHDFVQCACKNETFVDGGDYYQRYGGHDMSQIGMAMINMKTKQISLLT